MPEQEVGILVLLVIGYFALMHNLERREIGKERFDRQSDYDKYKGYIEAHYWGAYLFLIVWAVIRFTLGLLGVVK